MKEKKLPTNFSVMLKLYRERYGITGRQVHQQSGVHVSTICRLEKGQTKLDWANWTKLLAWLFQPAPSQKKER